MDVHEAVKTRRSVREYLKTDVSNLEIAEILEAGRWAPSGLNNQPWKFMVVRGEKKDAFAKHTKYGRIITGAPVCIAVFYDVESGYDRDKDMQSIGACIQNMLLAIHSIGLGAVWLGEIKNQHAAVEKELDVKHELMAVIALGWPTKGTQGDAERKEMQDLVV
ncbi:MAG: nitroreductase [Candidatus Altiarchaeota archaeon]|nr:nitroreductase [Candidatus Altiarchaeota archaeon]